MPAIGPAHGESCMECPEYSNRCGIPWQFLEVDPPYWAPNSATWNGGHASAPESRAMPAIGPSLSNLTL
uniref:Uncharacterized protein n=1 Tax=Candidatus Kentrum eta TaxID=2126337 RepID=A0A450UBI5_9GAMM|nr:MAG: hypothetical protein BECKH772A_GA0070896_1001614 [Candidatus Kentron sp. H]VFJ92747.1 MAG: hypothetical protein BECKH772B_GA0070898_100335 [Candidatus Kentron sp. H]VFJ97606.1 MAG: hypothetical protein BECKH772C_GA0070978_1001413 [Candidatus Kentron sp. H]